MLKLLTEIQKLKGRWITFTELQELHRSYREELATIEKLNKQYLYKFKEECRDNDYLREANEMLTKKYTVLSVIFWLVLIGNNLLWFMFT